MKRSITNMSGLFYSNLGLRNKLLKLLRREFLTVENFKSNYLLIIPLFKLNIIHQLFPVCPNPPSPRLEEFKSFTNIILAV